VTGTAVAVAPALSVTTAVSVYVPDDALRQVVVYEGAVESKPIRGIPA
jgi:hypothetical protein